MAKVDTNKKHPKLKIVVFNLLGIVAMFLVLFFLLKFYLQSYTRHGEVVSTPALIGMPTDEAIKYVDDNGFKYEIMDTVFDDKYPKGTVVEQNPRPETPVKEGRRIYLLVNSSEDRLIDMPNFVGLSIRQVKSQAAIYGVEIGRLRYVRDIAVNKVVTQRRNGSPIEPGTKIKRGSRIDFDLGLGDSNRKTLIPSLLGLTYEQAYNKMLDMYLNVGDVCFDLQVRTKADSAAAKIYKQSPRHSTINKVNLGCSVDIWLTKDADLVETSKEELTKIVSEEELEEHEDDDNDEHSDE